MRRKCWLIAGLLVPLAFVLVGASAWDVTIRSVHVKERTRGYREFLSARQRTVSTLLGVVGDEEALEQWSQAARAAGKEDDWRTPRTVAMRLLGDLRAAEAVPILFEQLMYDKPWTTSTDSWTMGDRYAAAAALVKIGTPAVRPGIDRIKVTKHDLERRACVWILHEVEGVAVTRLRLQHELQIEEKPLFRHRLRLALGILETLYAAGCPQSMQWEAGAWERARRKADQTGAESTP